MKKTISTFAIFTTFSLAAMANAYDQLPAHKTLGQEQKSVHVSGEESTAKNPRFAGLGGLFGNQQIGKVAVTYQHKASSSRFVGLGGLFGNQDESVAPVKFQQIDVAANTRFPGLGVAFSGQRTAEISLNSTIESVL